MDHFSIQCADLSASSTFYDDVLAPLGGHRIMDFGVAVGFGTDDHPHYYGGFVRDPDGNNAEAVCHRPVG